MGLQEARRVVLVVEDDRPVGELLAGAIGDEPGFYAIHVTDPAAAIETAKNIRPDVLVVDVGLPGMSGLALIERLEATRPETRIVAMSGYSRIDDDSTIPSTVTLLRKPFTNAQMFSALRAAMTSAPAVAATKARSQ